MEKFNNTMLGRQVRFISGEFHKISPSFYPAVGTIGIITPIDGENEDLGDFMVQWPKGSTSIEDRWFCPEEFIELLKEITDYTPEKYGIVEAMRIFYGKARWPYATLAFAFGGTVTIDWADVKEREKYMPGINAYTLVIDDRVKNKFENYVRVRDNNES